MALILDAGALIAFESSNPVVLALLNDAHVRSVPVKTTSGATAQVWRDRAKQVQLTLLLRGVDEQPIDTESSPRIGSILTAASVTDIVDGSLIEIASDGDEILTTDPDDIVHLASAAGRRLVIIPISTCNDAINPRIT